MSSVYVSEPPTKGKVILHTSYGPLDIELWPKEAPRAVRNFVQLCLEGYYHNTIFHRIIKSFLVQGGDPTGSGTGGESIYGNVFVDEFHSRLRFNHRGLVACANSGSPHSNGSQFFFSLDRCDWLDRKHTIFGKVTGDSMYNLLQLSEVETDKDDRPLDQPPIIISVEVLWNPFDDIVPRGTLIRSFEQDTSDHDKKPLKASKNLSLLSFGEEAGEEAGEDENEIIIPKQKIKSSHDVLNDPRLLKDDASGFLDVKKQQELQLSVREMLRLKKVATKRDSESELLDSADKSDDEDEAGFDSRMRQQILRKRKEHGELPPNPKQRIQDGKENAVDYEEPVYRSKQQNPITNEPIKEKLSIKRKGIGSEVKAARESNADVDLQLLGEAERGRLMLKQKKRRLHGREDEVLEKLEKFKKDLSQKQVTSSDVDANEDVSHWRSAPLKFAAEHGKMTRNEEVDDYVVHDPLLEKGKEKFNRMQAREKRRGREWAGKSLT